MEEDKSKKKVKQDKYNKKDSYNRKYKKFQNKDETDEIIYYEPKLRSINQKKIYLSTRRNQG